MLIVGRYRGDNHRPQLTGRSQVAQVQGAQRALAGDQDQAAALFQDDIGGPQQQGVGVSGDDARQSL